MTDRRREVASMVGQRWVRLTLAWFILVYGVASLNPVYTDEIAYEYMLGRFFRDDGGQFFMWPECSSFHQAVPFIWQAPRWLIAGMYYVVPNLLALRMLGFLIALLNGYLLYRILAGFFPKVPRREVLQYLRSLTVGVLPFLMVMMRPEGLLIFCALASIALCQSFGGRYPRVAATCVMVSAFITVSTHPLGIAETPIFVACLWSLRRETRIALPILVAVLVYAGISAPLHGHLLRCDENPAVAHFLELYRGGRFSVDRVVTILYDLPFRSFGLFNFMVTYVSPRPGYMSGIVPLQVWGNSSWIVQIGTGLVLVWFVAFCWLLIRSLGSAIRGARCWERLRSFPGVVGIGVLCSLVIFVSAQPFLLPYRLSFVMPLFLLVGGLLGFSSLYEERSTFFVRLNMHLGRLATASCVVVLMAYLPIIIAELGQVTSDVQPHSTNHIAPLRPSLAGEVVAQCGLKDGGELRRMFVDEHTYWLFRDSHEPVFFTYTGFAEGPLPAPELWRRLISAEAGGVVVHCASVRRVLLSSPKMRRVGEICCLNGDDILALAAS